MPDDLDRLQGSWAVRSLEMDGMAMAEVPPTARITIDGDRFVSSGMGADYGGTVRIDESASPRRIDLKFETGPEKGNVNRGIYKFDGDSWVLCLSTRGHGRPPNFRTSPGTGIALETLVRGEGGAPKKTPKRAVKKAAGPIADPPATEWEGEWAMVSGIFSGAPMDAALLKWVKRVTRGNQTKVTAGPQVMVHAEFTLDPASSPKAVDYINIGGTNKGKPQAGIYKLAGDELTICMSGPGAARPAEFQSKKGDGSSLTVWQRV